MLICLHIVYGYFCAKITELTSYSIKSMAENIYFLGLYRKCLLTPVSYSEVDGECLDFSFKLHFYPFNKDLLGACWVPSSTRLWREREVRHLSNLFLLIETRKKMKYIEVPNIWSQNYGIYNSERSLRESIILVRSSGTRGILKHTKNREIIIVHKDVRSIREKGE